jgi:hypothetical protein
MADHTHLDQQRRQRGICPACDAAWDLQEARLTAQAPTLNVIKQLERMGDRPKPASYTLCPAFFDGPPGGDRSATHTCGQPPDHPGQHRCPECGTEWT